MVSEWGLGKRLSRRYQCDACKGKPRDRADPPKCAGPLVSASPLKKANPRRTLGQRRQKRQSDSSQAEAGFMREGMSRA